MIDAQLKKETGLTCLRLFYSECNIIVVWRKKNRHQFDFSRWDMHRHTNVCGLLPSSEDLKFTSVIS